MDERYDSYCAVDPLFYDSLASASTVVAGYATDRPVPDGWECQVKDDWLIHGPVDGSLPQQGWKIHVSARLDNAERVLTRVMDYCQPRGIPFKHLRGPRMLLMRNSKYARRGGSGKFITVYPRDDAELELTAKELAALLDGEQGPYILSDLRYGDGPVYLRYGGFAARYCLSPDGQVVPAIEDAGGSLVPDRRDPVFHVPECAPGATHSCVLCGPRRTDVRPGDCSGTGAYVPIRRGSSRVAAGPVSCQNSFGSWATKSPYSFSLTAARSVSSTARAPSVAA
nr:hypothetical protein [Micromonospora sp. 4G55]